VPSQRVSLPPYRGCSVRSALGYGVRCSLREGSERVGRLSRALAQDDQQARKVRLLRLGKGVVSAHRIERRFAARLDGGCRANPLWREFVVDRSNDPWGHAGGRTEESQVATCSTASPEPSLDFSPTPLVCPTASRAAGGRP
jgi:hypothetical protein